MENGPDIESTPVLEFGTAVHCAVLEPETFAERYATRPADIGATIKEGKAFKAAADAEGKIVLSEEHARWCAAIMHRVNENRRMAEWLSHDHATEVSLVWERDGFLCRARADLVIPGLNIIADLKTTLTASPEGFARQIGRYHYHTQGAWYVDGMRRLTGQEWTFWLIAAEKHRPFLVTLYELVAGSVAQGAAISECDALFEQYKRCSRERVWPGYGDVFEIVLPEWALLEVSSEQEESFE